MDSVQIDAPAGPDGGQPAAAAPAPPPPDLIAAIRRLSRASVLVVGDVMLDRYIYGKVSRISSEAPVPILHVEREVALPGGAGSVVRNLSALGAATAFVAIVGDDQPGSDLTGLIGGQPAVEPWLLVQGGRVTTRKTRFVARGQQLLRSDREQADPIHPKLAERLVKIASDVMAATGAVILSDYALGVLANDVASQLIAAAKRANRRVVVQPRGPNYARYAGADIMLPTARDLADATALPVDTDSAVVGAARLLRAEYSLGAVLVLRGEAGMTLVDGERAEHFPSMLSGVYELAGTGDTVVATVGAGLAAGLDIMLAIRLATIAAGIVAGRPNTGVARELDLLAAVGLA